MFTPKKFMMFREAQGVASGSAASTEDRASQADDIFEQVGDPNADLEIQRREKQGDSGEQSSGQQQQQQQTQQRTPDSGRNDQVDDNGVFTDKLSGRRYILEGGRREYLAPEGEGEQQPQQQQQGGQQAQTQTGDQQQQSGGAIQLTPDMLKSIIGEAVGATQQTQQQQTQQQTTEKEPTAEEIDKAMNRWNPPADFFERLNGTDPKVRGDALLELRDGIVKEAATAASHIVQMAMQDLQPTLKPVVDHVNQQKIEKWRSDFFKQFPALEGQDELLAMVTAAKQTAGWKPKTREDGFKEIAGDVEKVLKRINPNFSLAQAPANKGQNGQQQQQQQTSERKTTTPVKMSSVSTGGSGGAGGGNGAKPKPVRGQADPELWGD